MPAVRKFLFPTFFIFALALSGFLAWQSIGFYQAFFGMYHDDGIYLITAKSLAEGDGYRIISLPGSPYETKYPIGYPFLLSLLWRLFPLFPENLLPLSILQTVLGFTAMLTAVLYLSGTRKATPALASVILCACIFNIHFLDFAPMLMSDMPFALLSFATMWLHERIVRKQEMCAATGDTGQSVRLQENWLGGRLSSKQLLVLAGFATALATLIRMQGLVLVFSCLAYLLCRRYQSGAFLSGCVTAALLIPEIGWNLAVGKSAAPYLSFYTNYVSHTYGTLAAPRDMLNSFLSGMGWSLRVQVDTYFPFIGSIPYATLPPLAFELIYRVVYPLLLLPLLVGIINALCRKSVSLPALYLLLFGLSLTIWPVNLEWRHILVVLPLAYYFYFKGCRAIARSLKPRNTALRAPYRNICAAAGLSLSLYLGGGTAAEALLERNVLKTLSPGPALETESALIEADYREAYAWITASSQASAVFISNNDPRLFLYTGRKAVMPSPLQFWRFITERLVDYKSLLEAINLFRADYVVSEPTFRSAGLSTTQLNESLVYLSRKSPGLLRPVFTSGRGLIRIFSVDRSKLPDR